MLTSYMWRTFNRALLLSEVKDLMDLGSDYHSYARVLWTYARRHGLKSDDCDDLVQDVFLVAHRRHATFRGECKPLTWLRRIAERLMYRRWRIQQIRDTVSLDALDVPVSEGAATPFERVEARQRLWLTYWAMLSLDATSRRLLIEMAIQERSADAMAKEIGKSRGAIWVQLCRCRRQIRDLLDGARPGSLETEFNDNDDAP